MRIAISLFSGVGYGGVTYFTHLLPALAVAVRDHELHLFAPAGYRMPSRDRYSHVVVHEYLRGNCSTLKRFLWEQFVLPWQLRRHRIDILFTAKNLAVFFAPCHVVIAIRNMEPFYYRGFKNAWSLNAQSWLKWQLTRVSVCRADAIIAVSDAVRMTVEERCPGARGRVRVVYNGNSVASADSVATLTVTEGSTFLLTASKFVAYANQLALVEGYARLVAQRPDAPPLWFAGGIHDARYFRSVRDRVAELRLTDRIRFLGLLPQGELHTLMRKAIVFIFPSLLEACPHTLIEAMACGASIATSNVPPMPEICGDAAVYFDPRDPNAIAVVISQLLDDASLRDWLTSTGRARAAGFTWERTALGLLNVFQLITKAHHS